MATYNFLNSNERKKYAEESLTIATKINYIAGKGKSYMLLGTLNNNLGNLPESKRMFAIAKSIANKTDDQDLQAGILWRMSAIQKDPKDKERMLRKADSIVKEKGDSELKANILSSIAGITSR